MTDPDFLQLPPMTILETARLRMRTVRVSDAVSLLPIITDKTTMKFTSGVVADDREVAERWLSARALGKDVLNFVITLKNGNGDEKSDGEKEEVVGIMGSYHWPEVGYLMHPAHAGNGYATEALHAFLDCYFSRVPSPSPSPPSPPPSTPNKPTLGFDYMQAETDSENIASQKVLLKTGFSLVETLVNSFDSPSLGLRDTLVYRVARPGMSLEELGLVEKPVRLLDLMRIGGKMNDAGADAGADAGKGREAEAEGEDGFVPPVQ